MRRLVGRFDEPGLIADPQLPGSSAWDLALRLAAHDLAASARHCCTRSTRGRR